MAKKDQTTVSKNRPPIVAVLGHVDHGKTSLLDYIRKSHVAAGEHGGITQAIGAYQIPGITFIDTPGHEAFAKMRARGATVSDIAILVVSADDSVMPQTKESIRMIKEANVSMIVAINKIDMPDANVDKVKQDLARNEVQVEGFGGDIPCVAVSAKTGAGVKELLDMIKLVAEMKELKNEPDSPLEAVVIENRVDKGKGMVATIVVKKGTLKFGVQLFDGEKQVAKVRAMFDENGAGVAAAPPSKPVEVLGFTALPQVGSVLTDKAVAKAVAPQKQADSNGPSVADFLAAMNGKKKLAIIVKADVYGSLEAILEALGDDVDVVSAGVGEITDADVLLAKSTGAFVIGFNVKLKNEIEKLAQIEGVICRTYTIIYELLDELKDVIEGAMEVISKERELGKGHILAEFPFNGERIAGIKVLSGRIAKGDQIKIMRAEEEIGRAKIKSVRHGKEEETKMEVGGECGILMDKDVEFALGDDIIAFTNH